MPLSRWSSLGGAPWTASPIEHVSAELFPTSPQCVADLPFEGAEEMGQDPQALLKSQELKAELPRARVSTEGVSTSSASRLRDTATGVVLGSLAVLALMWAKGVTPSKATSASVAAAAAQSACAYIGPMETNGY